MIKKILLIYPPYERFRGACLAHFPVGLGYLATILELQGYQARIYNADFGTAETTHFKQRDQLSRTTSQDLFQQNVQNPEHPIWEEIRQVLSTQQPDLVGVYTTTVAYPIVLRILKLARQINPAVRTVLGGPHVTVLPDQVMQQDVVDFILMGEAEYTLPQLCAALNQGNDHWPQIPGLGYRQAGSVTINKEYRFIEDLSALPVVNRDLVLFKENYPAHVIGGTIIGSRGCPYACTFCASSLIWRRQIRYRCVDKLLEELKYLTRKFQLTHFAFLDDTFTSHFVKTREFCEGLISSQLKLSWTCLTRANLITPELLQLVRRAGCHEISIGIESGSDRVLQLMRKGIDVATVRRAARLIRKHELRLKTFFMVGLPYETAADIRQTIALIKELRPDKVNLSTFFPYPGTAAHDEVVKQGLLPADYDWAQNLALGHHSLYNRFTPHIPEEEFRILVLQALQTAKAINRARWGTTLKKYWRRKYYYLTHPLYTWRKIIGKLY